MSKNKKKQSFNWFGKEEKKKSNKTPFNFLSGSNTKVKKYKSPFSLTSSKVYNSYPKNAISFMTSPRNKSKPNVLSFEESLYGKKNLRKFGDKDMDGSPNIWDCKPGIVSKDGPVGWLKERAKKVKQALSTKPKGWKNERADTEIDPLQRAIQNRIIKKEKMKDVKSVVKNLEKTPIEFENGKPRYKKVSESEKRNISKDVELENRIAQAKEKSKEIEQFKEGGRYYGRAGKIKLHEEAIAEKIARGEQPTSTELQKLYEAKEKYKQTNVIAALRAGELPSAKAIKTTVRAAGWSPEAASAGRKFAGMTAGVLGAILPTGTMTSTSRGSAGRPRGSFKNYIPGKGSVDIYTYRKWARQQRALSRMKGELPEQQQMQMTAAELTQESQQYDPAKAGLNDQGNYDNSQYQAPQSYDSANLPPDQARGMRSEQQAYQRVIYNQKYDQAMARLQAVRSQQMMTNKPALAVQAVEPQFKNAKQVLQYQEQMTDNTLNAPNIQKGEMVGAGQNSFTYTSPEQNILNAPNVMMGQMRNVDSLGDIPSVRLSEKPIPNPYGDQYAEIDPVSGKMVMKRRISERWMDGRAY